MSLFYLEYFVNCINNLKSFVLYDKQLKITNMKNNDYPVKNATLDPISLQLRKLIVYRSDK